LSGAELPDSADPALIEQTLRGLKVKFEAGKDSYDFTLQNRRMLLRRLDGGAKLLLQSTHAGKAGLDAINRYNADEAVTTRAVRYPPAKLVLEAGLDCRLGISSEVVRRFITGFATDLAKFEQFMAKQPAVTKGPPLVALGDNDKSFEIEFPTTSPQKETAWRIEWDMQTGAMANKEGFKFKDDRIKEVLLFRIKKAYFRPGARAPWVQVLEDAHASEFYVPYFNFKDTYFFDLAEGGNFVSLLAREGGARGRTLGKDRLVMAEVRDRGLAFKHGKHSRRGEALAMWANFEAGNYTYLVEFIFQDDGTIVFRHAPTGYNLKDDFDKAAHMHTCGWRIGVNLRLDALASTFPSRNEVRVVKLRYDPKKDGHSGEVDFIEVKRECALDWDAKEFTTLRVTNPDVVLLPRDAKKPERSLPISYDLVPLMQGQARHHRDFEKFTEHDFYVTRPDCPEKMYMHLHKHFANEAKLRPLEGGPVVLWHMSSEVHVPRGEDGIFKGASLENGQAQASWTTVELRPRNLFASTPLYPKEK
jgi:hypothetical protein